MNRFSTTTLNILIPLISVVIIGISNYLGYINPPVSIYLTPVVMGAFVALILFLTSYKPVFKFGLISGLIIFNDILIKRLTIGTLDHAESGWVLAFLIFGIVISMGIIIVYSVYSSEKRFWLSFLLFVIIMGGYFSYFSNYNLIYRSTASESISKSKEEGLFLAEFSVNNDPLVFGKDTIKINQAWIEKEVLIDHTHLFKTYSFSKEYLYIIDFKGFVEIIRDEADQFYYRLRKEGEKIVIKDGILKFSLPQIEDKQIKIYYRDQEYTLAIRINEQ